MEGLLAELGDPQRRFDSIHVVGSNGKTSVTRMTAALLEAHGRRAGAYVSPHLGSWAERVEIGGAPLSEEAHAWPVQQTAEAAERIGGGPEGSEPISQFEIATASAFLALADAEVEAAVVEAGLGGRLDATNVLGAPVCVLTSIAFDHTQWLGETLEEIAAEKLAVVRDGATLVCGELPEEVGPLVEERRALGGVEVIHAPADPGPDLELAAPGGFQRRNFALAIESAGALLGGLRRDLVRRVGAEVRVPGRLELVDGDPPAIFDAAHNPAGMAATVEALSDLADGRPVVACFAALEEKDTPAMVEALAPAIAAAVCTETEGDPGGGRGSAPAAELAERFERAGVAEVEAEPRPREAWRKARDSAARKGGVAIATGSVYLLRALWTGRPDPSSFR